MAVTSYLVAIGSNRRHHRHGRPEEVVEAAADALAGLGTVAARSPILATAPLGPGGRRFANAAVRLDTALTPPGLLGRLKRMERDFGRRPGRRWGARVLDLDIILWSRGRWRGRAPALTIPHPAWSIRGFVLVPLARIAPGWRDPRGGATVRQRAWRLTRARPKPR